MRQLFGTAIVVLWLCRAAVAGHITITGEDIVWPAGQSTSPQYLFKVKSDTGTDIMMGWQLTLAIIPDADATGSLQFKSASLPSDSMFPRLTSDLSPTLPSGNVGPLSGYVWPGITIPATWSSLLSVDFEASEDAAGRFGIAVLSTNGSVPLSVWANTSFEDVAFANVPFNDAPVVVGSVLIGSGNALVPEPATGISAALAGFLLFAVRIVHRRGRVGGCS